MRKRSIGIVTKKTGLLLSAILILFSCRKDDSSNIDLVEPPIWYSLNNQGDTIRAMINTRQYIWAATQNKGLLRISKTDYSLSYFNSSNSGLKDNEVIALAEDKTGKIWLGTANSGLYQFDGANWKNFNLTNSALPNDRVTAIVIQNDSMWLGTYGGLVTVVDGNWSVLDTSNSPIPCVYIRCLLKQDDKLWMGTQTCGLIELDNGIWTQRNQSNSDLSDNSIRFLELDEKGKLWTASFYKHYSIDENQVTVFDQSVVDISSNYINDMSFDMEGNRYLATHHGFNLKIDSTWVHYFTTNSPLPDNIVEIVLNDENHNTWIGTFNGIVIYNNSGIK